MTVDGTGTPLTPSSETGPTVDVHADPLQPEERLFADLRSRPEGLSNREVERRLIRYGANEIVRRGRRQWWRDVAKQLTHPLALLLWAATALAWFAGTPMLAGAIVGVILLNAAFALLQERQAERAVEALAAFLPEHVAVLRDGRHRLVEASQLVPGDVVVLTEGDRVPADARLIAGSLQIDTSALTGESVPVTREAGEPETDILLEARDLVFSGTSCTGGQAHALVYATGMQTELGRISALSERIGRDESPLERQVRRVAKLIALVAVAVGVGFLPLGLLAGLPFSDALVFAVGLLVANVPEGLLPTITLALAVGVRALAKEGALVKRLSAVETLGSTTVICTDKTGTLTLNRMSVVETAGDADAVSAVGASCNTADIDERGNRVSGDPTEVALLAFAQSRGRDVRLSTRERRRRALFGFDSARKLMTVVDDQRGELVAYTKGAPEYVLARCTLAPEARAASLAAAEACASSHSRAGTSPPSSTGTTSSASSTTSASSRCSTRRGPRCRRRSPRATARGSASSSSPATTRSPHSRLPAGSGWTWTGTTSSTQRRSSGCPTPRSTGCSVSGASSSSRVRRRRRS
jgi:magnesium-transporting ATPase (P-type)